MEKIAWDLQGLVLLFSHSVLSDSLRPHALQHRSLLSPLPSPGACSNSCPLSQCCYPTISSSVFSFSSCLQSYPASGFFWAMNQLFELGGQSIGASAVTSVLPVNIQGWFLLGLTGLIWPPAAVFLPGEPMDSVKRQDFRALEVADWWDQDPLLYKSGCFYPLFPLYVLFSFCFKVPSILVSLRELRAELYLCFLARTWRKSWPWRPAW